MFCKGCGKEIKEGNKFCNYCGQEFFNDVSEINISGRDKELKTAFKKSLIFKIVLAITIIVFLYIIFSDKPFSFLYSEKKIDQNIIMSSVVNILCESDEGLSGGSGTIISTDGFVITNSHVIPQDEEYLLTPEEGCLVIIPNQKTGEPEEMYWADPIVYPGLSDDYDLAYLKIYDVFIDEDGMARGEYPKVFQSIFAEEKKYDNICLLSSEYKLGDSVRIFGYPQSSGGFYLTITDGVISSFSDDGFILTSAKIDAGNSGGLAIDKRGCMVGIPVAISEGKYQNLGVIIPTFLILEFSEKLPEIAN